MTTVAFKIGLLVADTALSDGPTMWAGSVNKITVLDDHGLAFTQAGAADHEPLISFIKKHDRLPVKSEIMEMEELSDVCVLIVYKDAPDTVWHLWRGENEPGGGCVDAGCMKLEIPFFAIGSGKELALGAMAAGADPVKAVKIAAKYGRATRTPLWIFDTHDWRFVET